MHAKIKNIKTEALKNKNINPKLYALEVGGLRPTQNRNEKITQDSLTRHEFAYLNGETSGTGL